MLRQDSIHSADIRSKGSPFRAKCHEIFCCPLKQAVLKESAEPEGLSVTHTWNFAFFFNSFYTVYVSSFPRT